jgi:hypothetical protein
MGRTTVRLAPTKLSDPALYSDKAIFVTGTGLDSSTYSGSQESEVCPMPYALCPTKTKQSHPHIDNSSVDIY